MQISVIGAAGMVGAAIVEEAIERGHDVRTFTKSGSGDGARALDLADTDAVVDVIDTSGVTVISTAGRDNYDAVVAAHKDLIAAAPVGRMFVIGGAGGLKAGEVLLAESPELPEEYRAEARAFVQVYQAYAQSSGLDWTMLAPSPMIAPGVRTGEYRTELDFPAGGFISAQDFAVAGIDEIEQPQHAGARFTAASVDEEAAGA
ncbi:NAD(P)-dependent oxidoreductase [Corynebacterium sp.]|uniref:NAD(P)-dependent oxidoreductase n=1 Tax=Corynebacterium sp. TaxID=1720 RepID=UPI002A91CFDD|nr:NAD(P)H-binding protein [Corynebacterium sp.]MDY5785431.1 NAD(P)H-binding protein [Corynebacterium sp.]